MTCISGVVIWWKPEWHIIDPILTLGFCVLVFWSTIGVLKSSVAILLEETPPGIDWREVYNAISAVSNVYNVHVSRRWFHNAYCIDHTTTGLNYTTILGLTQSHKIFFVSVHTHRLCSSRINSFSLRTFISGA